MRQSICIFLFLTVLGCGPKVIDIKKDHSEKFSFTSDEGYQEIYRRISNAVRKCWYQRAMVTSDLYTDLGFGEFIVYRAPGFSRKTTELLIEVRRVGRKRTVVDGYIADDSWDDSKALFEQWTNGSTDCKA